ncbi:MAG: Ferric enterobactin receptor precursor [Bacteroidetes bacterium]|nr:Ferric enterobactin receptor precursor [Bacteroidota bacterium]
MNKLIVLTLLLCLALTASSQPESVKTKGKGKVTGKIVDSLSKAPLEYATISLGLLESSKVINGTTSDDKGNFKMDEIPDGTYKLVIYFIGYNALTLTVSISPEKQNLSLNEIKLSSRQNILKEVTVTAEQNLIENKIDKMVYNADKDLTAQGGVASDLLKKIPMVSVDVNGNVELQGNSNIRFLINGKPSSVFGSSVADVLQAIPASQIQSIEVITSPGAKYDAEGTGGIINIILKKNNAQGINGNVSLTAGTRLENGSINLGARKGRFGINGFLSGNGQLLSRTTNVMDRESAVLGQSTSLLQNGYSDFTRSGYQAGLSFDLGLTGSDNITGGVNFNYFGNTNSGVTNRRTIQKDTSGNTLSDVTNLVNSINNFSSQSLEWNCNYKRTFEKADREFEILYSASDASNYSTYSQSQRFPNDSVFSGSYGKNPGTDLQNNISLNYVEPVNNNIKVETGAKAVFNTINSVANVYLLNGSSGSYDFNTTQSGNINYERNVYAAYLSAIFKTKIVDVKTGLRYEYTETNASFSSTGKVDVPAYGVFVPSAIVSKSLKNRQMIKLSYSYRIQRPDYRDLNPFVNASDPKNLTTGNPLLKPEYTHNIEGGYSKVLSKGGNINVNLFYRGNRADIQAYTVLYPTYKVGDSVYTNVAVTTRENIGTEDNYGMNIFASVPVTAKINLRGNLSGFQRYIYSSIIPGNSISGFNYRVNLTATYIVSSTLSFEVFGNFNSPRLNVQGTMPSFTTYNFAFRKQFWNKKASFAFTTTNPFNKNVEQKTQTRGQNFTLYNLKELPYRSFGINFTYKFGKLEFKKDRMPEDVNLTNPGGN